MPDLKKTALESARQVLSNLMQKYSYLGALDSEPRYCLSAVEDAGRNGKPFPLRGRNPWELYSSFPGWQTASSEMTEAALHYWKRLIEQHLGVEVR